MPLGGRYGPNTSSKGVFIAISMILSLDFDET